MSLPPVVFSRPVSVTSWFGAWNVVSDNRTVKTSLTHTNLIRLQLVGNVLVGSLDSRPCGERAGSESMHGDSRRRRGIRGRLSMREAVSDGTSSPADGVLGGFTGFSALTNCGPKTDSGRVERERRCPETVLKRLQVTIRRIPTKRLQRPWRRTVRSALRRLRRSRDGQWSPHWGYDARWGFLSMYRAIE